MKSSVIPKEMDGVRYTQKQFERLMHLACAEDVSVLFSALKYSDGRYKGMVGEPDRLAIRNDMTYQEYVYILAHELAHHFLHYDKGNMMESDKRSEYEEQADRAAKMLLKALETR